MFKTPLTTESSSGAMVVLWGGGGGIGEWIANFSFSWDRSIAFFSILRSTEMEPVNSQIANHDKQTTRNLRLTAPLIKHMYMLLNDKAILCLNLQNLITFKRKGKHFNTFNFK